MTCGDAKLRSGLTCGGGDELTEGEFVGEDWSTSSSLAGEKVKRCPGRLQRS